jgi:hypothetical protein
VCGLWYLIGWIDTRQGTSFGAQRLRSSLYLWNGGICSEESRSLSICETHRAGGEGGNLNTGLGAGDSQVGVSRSGSAAVTDGAQFSKV